MALWSAFVPKWIIIYELQLQLLKLATTDQFVTLSAQSLYDLVVYKFKTHPKQSQYLSSDVYIPLHSRNLWNKKKT